MLQVLGGKVFVEYCSWGPEVESRDKIPSVVTKCSFHYVKNGYRTEGTSLTPSRFFDTEHNVSSPCLSMAIRRSVHFSHHPSFKSFRDEPN